MRIRLILAVATSLALAACSESATAPRSPLQPAPRSADELTCRGGYHIATRLDGTEYCEADAELQSATRP